MTVNKVELQDSLGNVIYPHTSGDIIDYDNNSSVVEKINDLQEKLTILKANLATVVNNKAGSSLTSDSTIQEVINEINSITTLLDSTKDATATANQILNNQTAYVNGLKVTGSMVDNGAVSPLVDCGGVYTIPEGYHNGSGKVTANSLANQTSDATAGTLQIVPPYTAYVNGLRITGSMNVMSVDSTDGTNFHSNAANCEYGAYSSGDSTPYLYLGIPQWSYTTKNGFVRTPASTVASKLGITADKIVSGNTICGISGTGGGTKKAEGTFAVNSVNYEVHSVSSVPFTPKIIYAYVFQNAGNVTFKYIYYYSDGTLDFTPDSHKGSTIEFREYNYPEIEKVYLADVVAGTLPSSYSGYIKATINGFDFHLRAGTSPCTVNWVALG